jgi:hypothetical protein
MYNLDKLHPFTVKIFCLFPWVLLSRLPQILTSIWLNKFVGGSLRYGASFVIYFFKALWSPQVVLLLSKWPNPLQLLLHLLNGWHTYPYLLSPGLAVACRVGWKGSAILHIVDFNVSRRQKPDTLSILTSPFTRPGLPGVLRHSVKLRTLPRDTSLIERVENKSYSDLAGMMTSPTQCTM